jgi:hypothetical protein
MIYNCEKYFRNQYFSYLESQFRSSARFHSRGSLSRLKTGTGEVLGAIYFTPLWNNFSFL